MSLVAVKNLLFSDPHARSSSARAGGSESEPLLPTTETLPSYIKKQKQSLTRPDCARHASSSSSCLSSNSSSTSLATTVTTTSSSPNKKSQWLHLDSRTISDATIGLSDGLTVPFALTAGLSAFNNTKVVIFGGCAELVAGSISMGLGGWLAGRGEAEFYENTLDETRNLMKTNAAQVHDLIYGVFLPYRIPPASVKPLVSALVKDSNATEEFLMSFHHQRQKPDTSERTPISSALTIAAGYFLGGGIPLLPYFFVGREQVMLGLYWSVAVMSVCLFGFGFIKSMAVGGGASVSWKTRVRGGVEMLAVGGLAAGLAWSIVRALG